MKTINLLPKLRQQELRDEAVLRTLFRVIQISVFSFLLVFLVQFGGNRYLSTKASDTAEKVKQLQQQVNKQENSKVKAQVEAINSVIANYKDLALVSPKWSKVVKAFTVLPPDDVVVSSMVIDFPKKSISIRGYSPTRELVIEFYNNILKDTKNFYNVDYPLENVASPKDINYHFTFFIHEELLK